MTLTGSPVNVLLSEYAASSAGRPFGFFEFALVGVPLLIGSVLIAVLLGRRLIPQRSPTTMTKDLSEHARTLLRDYPGLGGDSLLEARTWGRRRGAGSTAIGLGRSARLPRHDHRQW